MAITFAWLVVLVSGLVQLAAAQGNRTYDPNNHFIVPPPPVLPHQLDEAAVLVLGEVQPFTWVTTQSYVNVLLWKENGSAPITLATNNYTRSSITWDGRVPLFKDGFNISKDYCFITVTNNSDSTGHPLFYSRYFRFVQAAGSSSNSSYSVTTPSATTSTASSSSAMSTSAALTSSVAGAATSATPATPSSSSSSNAGSRIGGGATIGVAICLLMVLGTIM